MAAETYLLEQRLDDRVFLSDLSKQVFALTVYDGDKSASASRQEGVHRLEEIRERTSAHSSASVPRRHTDAHPAYTAYRRSRSSGSRISSTHVEQEHGSVRTITNVSPLVHKGQSTPLVHKASPLLLPHKDSNHKKTEGEVGLWTICHPSHHITIGKPRTASQYFGGWFRWLEWQPRLLVREAGGNPTASRMSSHLGGTGDAYQRRILTRTRPTQNG